MAAAAPPFQEGTLLLKATGHPVSGQPLKPTYLTGEALLRGKKSVFEVAIDAKKSELRIGVVNRPEYLRVAAESGGSRSFHSSCTVDCVAYFLMWKKGAALAYGNERQPTMAAVTASAGDTVRLEVDWTNTKVLATMKVYLNKVPQHVGEMTLPADWMDVCFGVQFFDHGDAARIVQQPPPYSAEVEVAHIVATPFVLAPPAPLITFPGVFSNPPAYWQRAGNAHGGNVDTYTLPASASVYAEVSQLFAATAASASKSYDVISISVVRDLGRFNQYCAKKQFMQSSIGSAQLVNERWLWHGTAERTVRQILVNGFLRDFSATAKYGDGTYFARDAAYSLHSKYAIPNNKGEQLLFLSRVCVGEPCVGTQGMKMPPPKSGKTVLHDSLVDRLADPTIFVLSAGSDAQAFAEFVLRVKRK
eukprot:gene8526-18157_t